MTRLLASLTILLFASLAPAPYAQPTPWSPRPPIIEATADS